MTGAHAAAAGWKAFAGAFARPTAVERMARGPKSAVYRLCGAGPRGAAVVAKAQSPEGLRIERTVYERVLPHLPIATLRCFGTIEMPDGWCWIFLEDAGGRAYSAASARDRALAARWLAELHAATARMSPPPALRHSGIPAYRQIAARIRRRAPAGIVRLVDALDSRWSELEAETASIPPGLTHGDFCARNLRVRNVRGRSALAVFDWDMAAWGVCAPDLAQTTLDSATPATQVYWKAIRRTFPHVDRKSVRAAARAGAILRLIAAIDWELAKSLGAEARLVRRSFSEGGSAKAARWALNNLRCYEALLGQAMRP